MGLLLLTLILGIVGELFVPTLPLNIPRRDFGVYSWLALFWSRARGLSRVSRTRADRLLAFRNCNLRQLIASIRSGASARWRGEIQTGGSSWLLRKARFEFWDHHAGPLCCPFLPLEHRLACGIYPFELVRACGGAHQRRMRKQHLGDIDRILHGAEMPECDSIYTLCTSTAILTC